MLNYLKAGYLFFIIYMSDIVNRPDKVTDRYFSYLKKAIEMNGALCIKIAQWLSNQKSLTPILEARFQSLHENCPEHGLEYTTKVIKEEFKQKINSISQEKWIEMSTACYNWYQQNVYSKNSWNNMISHILYD